MKPLILSFFAVLLGYSLWFDKEDEAKLPAMNQATSSILPDATEENDSVSLYAEKSFLVPMLDLKSVEEGYYLFLK